MTLKQPARERRVGQRETKKNDLKLEPPVTSWLFFILLLNRQNQDNYSAVLLLLLLPLLSPSWSFFGVQLKQLWCVVGKLSSLLSPLCSRPFKEHTYLTWTSCREHPAPIRRHTSHAGAAAVLCRSSGPSNGTLISPPAPQTVPRLLMLNGTATCVGAVYELLVWET